MNNKSHSATLSQMPDWWKHSMQAWLDLTEFFSVEQSALPANWQRLTKGQSNFNYKLTLKKENAKKLYFIQVVNVENLVLLPQNKAEQQPVLSFLRQYSLMKYWLVDCYLSTPSVRVFDWIEFKPLSVNLFNPEVSRLTNSVQEKFLYDDFLSSVSEFISRLHKIENLHGDRKQPVTIDIRQHLIRYHQLASKRSPEHIEHIDRLLQHSLPLTEEFTPHKLCHNDLSLNNLLWDDARSQLKVIDWEYACYSDPVMDLAGFLLNFQLNNRQQQTFVEQYAEKTGLFINPDKLRNMNQLCKNISTLWQFCSARI